MSPPVGWAGKVSESLVFQMKFPTILISRFFRKSSGPRSPGRQAFPPNDARRMIDALVVEEIALLVPQPAGLHVRATNGSGCVLQSDWQ